MSTLQNCGFIGIVAVKCRQQLVILFVYLLNTVLTQEPWQYCNCFIGLYHDGDDLRQKARPTTIRHLGPHCGRCLLLLCRGCRARARAYIYSQLDTCRAGEYYGFCYVKQQNNDDEDERYNGRAWTIVSQVIALRPIKFGYYYLCCDRE